MLRYGWRRSPLRLFAVIVLAILAANLIAGLAGGAVGAGIGLALILPFLLFKMFFIFMMFSLAWHVFGGRWPRRRREPEPMDEDEKEYRDAVRRARERLDDIFPQV